MTDPLILEAGSHQLVVPGWCLAPITRALYLAAAAFVTAQSPRPLREMEPWRFAVIIGLLLLALT